MSYSDPIPLVDLKAQYATIRGEVDAAIAGVVESASFILGPAVREFEDSFARYCGAAHCVGVSSGSAALELSLRVLEVGPGDDVVTVAHTFIATAEAISAVGARPLFVDIDPRTYTMEPQALERAITPATRAVIPVALYGQPADMEAICAIARKHGLPVIDDAAQAHGACFGGRRSGVLADVSCFSFYPGKNLGAYGDAGAIVTDDAQIAEGVRLLRNHGRREKYVHAVAGFGERLDTLQAAVLSAKLPHLEAWVAARRRIAARYMRLLDGAPVTLPWVHPCAEPAWHLYVIGVEPHLRDGLIAHLRHAGIEGGVHYPLPLHLQPAYAHLAYRRGDLPVTEDVAARCVSLPIYPELSEAQQDRVVAALRDFLENGTA